MPRIYMLEDDRWNGRVIRRALDSLGCQLVPFILGDAPVLVASIGEEAIRANPPALVVTDGLDGEGHRVVSACKDMGVPVIVYTGSARAYDRSGAVVIPKPDLRSLKAAVIAVIDDVRGNG